MKILITGANGFLGKNMLSQLVTRKDDIKVVCFTRNNNISELPGLLNDVDFVFHFAGVNRPRDPNEFIISNISLTETLYNESCNSAKSSGKKIRIIFTSSIQAELDNSYGKSKLAAEKILLSVNFKVDVSSYIFRLPNVFGRWCKPNYNSMISTFCYNIARDLPIVVHKHDSPIIVTYIDDVIRYFIQLIDGAEVLFDDQGFAVGPQYFHSTVGEIAQIIRSFRGIENSLRSELHNPEMLFALYQTYNSYLPNE